ncbi:CocE/NonD family hydrolase [Dyadobacter sandarakinus]|uniref:CocE/NonD family hydrolase n=1 Tax=Dyadobacter sandarakinus TaxID=2747268 RepID=A0ABX7IE63_9BACT|nr:CocE/NonD family hydrolase [Dyadobacter sandarakinus]QRR03408.1 CocE/NonD family hydrolase [Dyadobacter sandarakinus]
MLKHFLLPVLLLISLFSAAQSDEPFIRENYTKAEYDIPVRDGIKLHTIVYKPKDASSEKKYPFLMQRTCYSVAPYGADKYPPRLGPSPALMRDKFIFVYQDVRGRYMSEGVWTNMTPHIDDKKAKTDVDEASDMYDTIEWLLKNIPENNGRVGQWGISYPGFYTTASALAQHPALKASSPQAPISDFFFDDFHHNGAFTQAYYTTFPVFGIKPPKPTTQSWFAPEMIHPEPDGYTFNMKMGPLKNYDKYYSKNFFWQETVNHPNKDEFWQKRDILPHLKGLKHAFMTVGGWFDAEDLYGPLNTYKTIEKNNPSIYNTLVVGPFGHGRWSRETGHTMHNDIYFGDSIATFYQNNIEATFFRHFLKEAGDGKTGLPEAYLFDTGKKQWKTYDKWPLPSAEKRKLYFHAKGKLDFTQPKESASASEYVSDPMKPVPYTDNYKQMAGFTPFEYMSEDQRFAAVRPDVLVFETEPLKEDMTLGGEITALLKISTTGTDADFFVKLIDVYPDNEPNHDYLPNPRTVLAGYQQMVRSEIMRARFRKSFEKPEPLVAGQVTDINFRLQDVLHTFKKGHRIMVQVQSTAFPLFDRNPQKYVENIYKAEQADFITAKQTIYHQSGAASALEVEVIK